MSRHRFAPHPQRPARNPPSKSSSKPRVAAPKPTEFYAEITEEGSFRRLKLMQRDLANLPVNLGQTPPGWEALPPTTVVKVRIVGGSLPEKEEHKGQGCPTPQAITVEVTDILGPDPAGLASLVAMANHRLPGAFPAPIINAAEHLQPYHATTQRSGGATMLADGRTDWRTLPIVTIDGADARDFDDAVWATPLPDGGHHVIVAIADVAFYVQPGSDLDNEARKRGNSTYLPDRVIPMLPEVLSNDLCSLRPHEDRPVLGVEMWFDAGGRLQRHRFHRALIHSAARLTYEQVQKNLDGYPDATTTPLLQAIKNLAIAYQARELQKTERGALDLDLPETSVRVDAEGHLADVGTRPRLTAHKLIEELMIAANVAAAEVLAKQGKGHGIYRIHDKPEKLKQTNLKAILGPMGFTVPAPESRSKDWARLVEQIQNRFKDNATSNDAASLLRMVLQSQQQARYSPANIGHFGLALPLYSHFTSPIRRYSDLVVHRALIACLKLPGWETLAATPLPDQAALTDLGEHLAVTERASQKAEWEARDRLLVEFFLKTLTTEAQRPCFNATVMGVQAFGLFVSIPVHPVPFVGMGVAEGLVPARLLGGERGQGWVFHAGAQLWQSGKNALRVGSKLTVKLMSADRAAGRLTFARSFNQADNQADDTPRERPQRLAEETPSRPKRNQHFGKRR